MIVTLDIPDIIARQLHLDGPKAGRQTLERLAVNGYRAGDLSRSQVSIMLALSFNETEAFLKKHDCPMQITVEEFDRQSEQLKTYLGQ